MNSSANGAGEAGTVSSRGGPPRVEQLMGQFTVDTGRYFRIAGWLLVVLIAGFVVWAALASNGSETELGVASWIFLGGFALLGLYLVATAGTLTVDVERILVRNLLGLHAIPWSEIERVEVDSQLFAMAFCSSVKCLPVPGPGLWSGPQAELAFRLVGELVEKHGIPTVKTQRALYRGGKGVRVKS